MQGVMIVECVAVRRFRDFIWPLTPSAIDGEEAAAGRTLESFKRGSCILS